MGGRVSLQIEATCKAEVISFAEYLNTKYKQELFLNIVKSNKSRQTNRNSTNEIPPKVVEDNGSHYISWTTTDKITMQSDVTECVQGNVGKIRHETLVCACAKIIETRSKIKVLWNQKFKTDRPSPNNRRTS